MPDRSVAEIWGIVAGIYDVSRPVLDEGALRKLLAQGRGFGGCRCQACSLTGDATADDPVCQVPPDHPPWSRWPTKAVTMRHISYRRM